MHLKFEKYYSVLMLYSLYTGCREHSVLDFSGFLEVFSLRGNFLA